MNYDDIGDSDDENTHDAYLEQMKAEGREKEEGEIDENEDSDPSSGNHIMICCEVSLMDSCTTELKIRGHQVADIATAYMVFHHRGRFCQDCAYAE